MSIEDAGELDLMNIRFKCGKCGVVLPHPDVCGSCGGVKTHWSICPDGAEPRFTGIAPRHDPLVGPHRDPEVCPDCGGVKTCGLMCSKEDDGNEA